MSDTDGTVVGIQGNAVSGGTPPDNGVLMWNAVEEEYEPRAFPVGIGASIGLSAFDAPADEDYTPDSPVLADLLPRELIEMTASSWTEAHAIIFPAAASGYFKTVANGSAYSMTVSVGTGTTRVLPAGKARRFWFDVNGVKNAGAEFEL